MIQVWALSKGCYWWKLCSIFGKQNVYIDPPSGAQPSNQFTLEQLISTPHKLQPNQYVGYGKSMLELLILSDVKILLLAWAYGNRRLNGNRAKVHYLNSNFKPRKGFGFREEGRFFSKISFLVNVLTPEDPWWPHRWHQQQGVVHRVWCDDVYLDNTVETLYQRVTDVRLFLSPGCACACALSVITSVNSRLLLTTV